MTAALERRTDLGFAGWGWADIVDRVTAVAAERAGRAGQDVEAGTWPGRIGAAAELLDSLIEGASIAGIYPSFVLDHVEGIVPACLDAVDMTEVLAAAEDLAEDRGVDVVVPPHLLPRPLGRACAWVTVRARTPLPVGQREGDELARWAEHVRTALLQRPEVRQVSVRGRGGTRRELQVAVRVPGDLPPAEYVRALIEQVDPGPLPAVPLLDVLVTA